MFERHKKLIQTLKYLIDLLDMTIRKCGTDEKYIVYKLKGRHHDYLLMIDSTVEKHETYEALAIYESIKYIHSNMDITGIHTKTHKVILEEMK